MRTTAFIFLQFCIIVSVANTAASAPLTPLLNFSGTAMHPGDNVVFSVYFHNESATSSNFIPPNQLKLIVEQDIVPALHIDAFTIEKMTRFNLQPGQFVKIQYSMVVPQGLLGTYQFSLGGFPANRAWLAISEKSGAETQNLAVAKSEMEAQVGNVLGDDSSGLRDVEKIDNNGQNNAFENLESLFQSYATNFSLYEPTYFLFGANPEESKFQLSFKYRLFNPGGFLSKRYQWLQGIHLAYTQTSFWNLTSNSAPFEATSYKPEILFLSKNIDMRPSWLDGLFVQTGLRHESNGRAGDESRATNTAYLKSQMLFYDEDSQLIFSLTPKLSGYFNNDDKRNPDLAQYRGYFEIESELGKAHGFMLSTKLGFASEGTSFEANLTYPISRLLFENLDLYFQIQYSNVLAESLLDYQERSEVIRMGVSVVR